jgi:hypothetical protein
MHQAADSKRGNRNDPSAPATGYIHETARLMGHPRAFIYLVSLIYFIYLIYLIYFEHLHVHMALSWNP